MGFIYCLLNDILPLTAYTLYFKMDTANLAILNTVYESIIDSEAYSIIGTETQFKKNSASMLEEELLKLMINKDNEYKRKIEKTKLNCINIG